MKFVSISVLMLFVVTSNYDQVDILWFMSLKNAIKYDVGLFTSIQYFAAVSRYLCHFIHYKIITIFAITLLFGKCNVLFPAYL